MTQNAEDPSVSGGFDLEDDSGFYLGMWAANVLAAEGSDTGSLELDDLGFQDHLMMMLDMMLNILLTLTLEQTWDFEETTFP